MKLRIRILLGVAARNIARQKRRALLLGGAVAFGALVMSLASGITAGMEKAVQDNVALSVGGHLIVSGTARGASGRLQARLNDDVGLSEKVKAALPQALSVSPGVSVQAALVFGTRQQSLRLSGVDWSRDRFYKGSLVLTAGDWTALDSPRAILLGSSAALRFGVGLGDTLLARFATVSGQQNVTEFSVAAIYDDKAAGGMMTVIAGFRDLAGDLGLGEGQSQTLSVFLPDARGAESAAATLVAALGARRGSVALSSGAEMRLDANPGAIDAVSGIAPGPAMRDAGSARGADPGASPGAAMRDAGSARGADPGASPGAAMRDAGSARGTAPGDPRVAGELRVFGDLRVATIGDLSGQVSEVLGTVSWIGYAVFCVMLALTAAGISNTFRMVLLERTREIGTLRCIGFRKPQIFLLVVAEAEGISLLGAAAGIVASLPLGALLGLIPFGANSTAVIALNAGRLVNLPQIVSLAIVVAGIALMAFAAAAGPARRASSMPPAEAMRATIA